MAKKEERQVIKFEQNLCNARLDNNEILFVRVGGMVKTAEDSFEVPDNHVAFLLKSGGDRRLYKSGFYDIFETKEEIKNWKKGASVEVIYMPVETDLKIRWGTTKNTMFYHTDPESNKTIKIGAHGEFAIQIENYEKFYRKVVGNRKEFNIEIFSEEIIAEIMNELTDVFSHVINASKIRYSEFQNEKKKLGLMVGEVISDKLIDSWGIRLPKQSFIIIGFQISDEDVKAIEDFRTSTYEEAKAKAKRAEAIAEIHEEVDRNWEKQKYVIDAQSSDNKAYYEANKGNGNASGKLFCTKCGNAYTEGDMFCNKCGNKLVETKKTCEKCGKENEPKAKFCSGCGSKL